MPTLLRRLVFAVTALIAACGSKPAAVPTTPSPEPSAATSSITPTAQDPDRAIAAEILAVMRGFAADVCACGGASCVEGVDKAMMDWGVANIKRMRSVTPTAAEDAAADAIEARTNECRTRIAATPVGGAAVTSASWVLAEMRRFRQLVCACPDAACIEVQEKAMMTWVMTHKDAMKPMKPTEAEEAEADRLEGEFDACKTRIRATTP